MNQISNPIKLREPFSAVMGAITIQKFVSNMRRVEFDLYSVPVTQQSRKANLTRRHKDAFRTSSPTINQHIHEQTN
jgi:hypothetical protein